MSATPTHRVVAARRSSAVSDAHSREGSRNGASLINAPPPNTDAEAPLHAFRNGKHPHLLHPSKRQDRSSSNRKASPEVARRSYTPRGTLRRESGGDGLVDVNHAAQLSPTTTNTKRRGSVCIAGNNPSIYTSIARPAGKTSVTEATTATHPSAPRSGISLSVASQRQPRSRSTGPSVSAIRPRTSLGSHLSGGTRNSELYSPTLSSVAGTPSLSVCAVPVHDAGYDSTSRLHRQTPESSARASTDMVRRGSDGPARALATPRASLQNVDDMSRLTPVAALTPKRRVSAAAPCAPVAASATATAATTSAASHALCSADNGTPTSPQLEYARAQPESMALRRLSGATFSYAGVERTPAAVMPAAAPCPDTLSRHPSRGIATPKEVRRRSASAGPSGRSVAVPALNLHKLHQPYQRGSSSTNAARGPRARTPLARAEASLDLDTQTQHNDEDALAVSVPLDHATNEPELRLSSDFLAHAFLAINDEHAMNFDLSSLSAAAAATNNISSGATPRSWVQRGASTPRAYSPHPEANAFSGSPVNRALRGKTETNASTTPRLSVSTPRFTVATNTNSLPYTARMSREGTPVSASLSPTAPVASATTCTAGQGDNRPLTLTPRPSGAMERTAASHAMAALEADTKAGSQDYVAAVAEQLSRHFFVILTALDIGRGAALQAEPPVALCLRSMVVDLNTVASLLSYDNRNGVQDLLFDDCAFATMDFSWLSRLTRLTALRFKGPRMTTSMVNRLLSFVPTVQTLTLINTSRITSLASIATAESRVHTLQIIQTDFTNAAYEDIVNCPVLQHVMLLQVNLQTNIFDLLNTNHLVELHLVGCPDIYYDGLPETEWVSLCSPRLAAPALPDEAPQNETRKPRAVRGGRGRGGRGGSPRKAKRPHPRPRSPPAFPLRALVIADCPGLQLSRVPFDDFRRLEEVSVMYQRGVRASDLAGALEQGRLTTLRLQEVFVDEKLIHQLRSCTSLQELNLSFCRGMQGIQTVWPALAESLRVLNVSFSEIDDDGLVGLGECRMLSNVYARGCTRLRSFDPFRRLSDSVGVIDLTDCTGMENDGFGEPFDCTGVHRLLLCGCSKVRTVKGIRSLRMLEELNLANTSVDDEGFVALARDTDAVVLQTLTKLDLSGCRHIDELADFAAASTTALRNLTSLSLSHSSISNKGVQRLAEAVQSGGGCLSELDVSCCTGVSDLGPLGAVKTLRSLDASLSAVGDQGLASFVQTSVDNYNRELRVLNLSGCTGLSNVGCLGQLPRLAILNLAGTTIDNAASFAGLAGCTGLQELDLSECMQVTSVVDLAPSLMKLLSLNLSLTGIRDDSVEALGALNNLEVLQLSGCPGVTCVAALGDLPLLQRLNLSATCVTDVAPLARCPQLWDVSLCSCSALTTLQPLANARTLQRLDASNTPITSDSFLQEWTCASLEELDVHDCSDLCSVTPGALRRLVSLRRVHASDSGLDDSGVAALAECSSLCEVQLSGCPITSLSLLGLVPTLQSIVARNIPVEDGGIAGLEVSESLTTLDFTGCKGLRDVSTLRSLRSLTTLTLCESGAVDASFACTWEQSGIRELNVAACAGICEPVMLHTLPGLEVLRASGSGINDIGVHRIAACPALRRLVLADCGQLTDLSPLALLDGLTHLDASNTPVASMAPAGVIGETAESLVHWAAASHLRHIVLRGCPAITDISALRHLRELYSADFTGSGITAISFADSWAGCESLEEMVLADCAAVHSVQGLWCAPHLMQVHLSRTAIDSIAGAEACTSLELLEVSECRRLKSILNVRALPRLQQLQCRGSDITDDSFAEPWTAPNLSEVNLSGCLQLRDVGALGRLPRLRSANFSETYVIDGALRELSVAPMLEDVDLRGCSRLAHLGSLSRMPRIRALYLSRTCIDNFTFTSLSRCTKLEVLEMEDCPYVTNVFVVFEFGQLRFLKFPPLSRMVGSVLHTCHNLEHLSLHGCPESFEIDSLSVLPRLRVLDLRESAVKKSVLAALSDCSFLEEVDVSYCTDFTSFDAMGRLPRLRSFLAAGLPVSDDVCVKLSEYATLEKIVLAECYLLHDVSALRTLPQLRHLNISESGATEASFIGVRHMRALEELSVHGCTAIRSSRLLSAPPDGEAASPATSTSTATPVFLPRLRLVDLSGTGIAAASASDDIAALRRQCPLLTKIYLNGSRASSSVPSALANIWRKLTGAK